MDYVHPLVSHSRDVTCLEIITLSIDFRKYNFKVMQFLFLYLSKWMLIWLDEVEINMLKISTSSSQFSLCLLEFEARF